MSQHSTICVYMKYLSFSKSLMSEKKDYLASGLLLFYATSGFYSFYSLLSALVSEIPY